VLRVLLQNANEVTSGSGNGNLVSQRYFPGRDFAAIADCGCVIVWVERGTFGGNSGKQTTGPIGSTRLTIDEDYLECALFCSVSKRVVCFHDVVHREPMRHQLARLQFSRTHDL
jgi:hypothetical protein